MSEIDAWRQLYELRRKYTKTWELRRDITIYAHALDRSVELVKWGDPIDGELSPRRCASLGKRNVNTMRELALILWAAADFVDESNPTWAACPGHDDIENPIAFELEDI
jgi:hypothetical protein